MVKEGFIRGFVTKDEYANTLRAYQKRQDEMNSVERDKAALLRRTGEGVVSLFYFLSRHVHQNKRRIPG